MMYLLFAGSMVLGLIMGSFLSMLIPRLHNDEKGIFFGRSHCSRCKHILKWYELIPLFSYLIQGGKCRSCKKSIGVVYPLTELSTAITFGVLFAYTMYWPEFIVYAILFSILIFIFVYDLRYQEIHDAVMLPGIFLAFAFSFLVGDPMSSLIGAGIGIAFFGIQWLISRGRWIGSGDIRIGAFMGFMLGWELMILALIFGYIIGSVVGIGLLLSKKADRKSSLPLGPFLVLGTVVAFFWGQNLIEWYLLMFLT